MVGRASGAPTDGVATNQPGIHGRRPYAGPVHGEPEHSDDVVPRRIITMSAALRLNERSFIMDSKTVVPPGRAWHLRAIATSVTPTKVPAGLGIGLSHELIAVLLVQRRDQVEVPDKCSNWQIAPVCVRILPEC